MTFRWHRQRPEARCSFSDGYNQCSDAKGWVLDTGARLWLLCSRAFELLQRCSAAEQAMGLGRAYTSTKLWRRQLSRAENELLLGRNTAVAQSLPV